MLSASLQDFIDTYDLDDKGVDAITQDDAGRVRFVFELFHATMRFAATNPWITGWPLRFARKM